MSSAMTRISNGHLTYNVWIAPRHIGNYKDPNTAKNVLISYLVKKLPLPLSLFVFVP